MALELGPECLFSFSISLQYWKYSEKIVWILMSLSDWTGINGEWLSVSEKIVWECD